MKTYSVKGLDIVIGFRPETIGRRAVTARVIKSDGLMVLAEGLTFEEAKDVRDSQRGSWIVPESAPMPFYLFAMQNWEVEVPEQEAEAAAVEDNVSAS